MLVLRGRIRTGVRGEFRHLRRPQGLAAARPRSSIGDSYDNALAETVHGLFKTELIRRRGPWRSMDAVAFATLEWVDWFNNRRILQPIGNIPPAEAEERYFAQQEEVALAA